MQDKEEEEAPEEAAVEAEPRQQQAKEGRGAGHQLLSAELLAAWCAEARRHASLGAMRNLLKVQCRCMTCCCYAAVRCQTLLSWGFMPSTGHACDVV